jgi:flavodoxin
MKDILVVYYSRTGKTRVVAEQLARLLDADLEEIREEKDRSGVLGYFGAGRDSMRKRPARLVSEHTRGGRKAVVLGMPVWAWSPPPAARAYLEQYLPEGARLCAFCTHGGGGGKRLFRVLGELAPGGVSLTFEWKNPQADDPELAAALKDWAAKVKTLAGELTT